MPHGKLLVGLANPSTEAIREMESKDRTWEMEALTRLFSLKTTLIKNMHLDYVFFDASPGLNYSSINAIVCADVVLLVTSIDRSDVEGTQRMLHELYELFDKKTGIIMNKVPVEYLSSKAHNGHSIKLELHQLPVVGVVPCSCEVLGAAGKCLFACERLDHPFTEKLREIAANLERFGGADEKCKMTIFSMVAEVGSSVNRDGEKWHTKLVGGHSRLHLRKTRRLELNLRLQEKRKSLEKKRLL